MISGINWRNSNPLEQSAFDIYQHFNGCIVMSNLGSEVANEIRRNCPDSLIIGRLWSDGGSLPEPMDIVNSWTTYIDETLLDCYQVDNEPDENYPTVSAEEYAIWWIRVVNLLMLRYPTIKWGFPMPSVKGEISLDYISKCKTAIVSADWIAERGYWQEEWQMESWHWGKRYQRTHLMFPNKEIHICEYGNSSDIDPLQKAEQYARYLKGLPSHIASAHAFIMAGGTIDWQKFWVTKEMAEVMMKDQFPELFNEWVAAGGNPDEAFELFLLGQGYITPDKQYLREMLDNMRSHLEEIAIGVDNLPLG